jgi:hypothetical protein
MICSVFDNNISTVQHPYFVLDLKMQQLNVALFKFFQVQQWATCYSYEGSYY